MFWQRWINVLLFGMIDFFICILCFCVLNHFGSPQRGMQDIYKHSTQSRLNLWTYTNKVTLENKLYQTNNKFMPQKSQLGKHINWDSYKEKGQCGTRKVSNQNCGRYCSNAHSALKLTSYPVVRKLRLEQTYILPWDPWKQRKMKNDSLIQKD